MKTIASFVTALIAALMLLSPAAAQTPIADDPTQTEGFVSWYMRLYMPENATPTASPAPGAVSSVILSVMTWETPEQAATVFNDFAQPLLDTGTPIPAPDGAVTLERVDGIGDQAVSVVYTPEPNATPEVYEGMVHQAFPVAMSFVQDGSSIYLVEVDNATDLSGPVEIATKMVEAGVADTPVELHTDGTSTGGPFDTMTAAADAAVMQTLAPTADTDLSQPEPAN